MSIISKVNRVGNRFALPLSGGSLALAFGALGYALWMLSELHGARLERRLAVAETNTARAAVALAVRRAEEAERIYLLDSQNAERFDSLMTAISAQDSNNDPQPAFTVAPSANCPSPRISLERVRDRSNQIEQQLRESIADAPRL